MKQLFLTRHADATWKDSQCSDFERVISQSGEQALQYQGERLAALARSWDSIITSPATRAITTAQTLAAYCGYEIEQIVEKPVIYTAEPMALLRLLQALDNRLNTVMLVGHNPAMSQLAGHLCEAANKILPTCGIYYLSLSVDCWAQITYHCAQLHMSLFP